MKGVKGASFGVRFYRRAGTKTVSREVAQTQVANAIESIEELERAMSRAPSAQPSERHSSMTDIPPQNFKFVLKRDEAASIKATNPEKMQAAQTVNAKEKMLWAAARDGDCYKIRVLVMDGVDLDARDAQGRTAINIATQYNRQDALKTLMAAREMRFMAKLGELPETKFFARFKTGTEGH